MRYNTRPMRTFRSSRFRSKRQGVNWKKIGTLMTLLVFVVMIFTSVRFFSLFNVLRGSDTPTLWRPDNPERKQILIAAELEGEITSTYLISIPGNEESVHVIGIPTNTLLDSDMGTTPLTAAFSSGHQQGINAINRLLGNRLPITHYFIYSIEGMAELLESLGSVDVALETGFSVRLNETEYVFASESASVHSGNVYPYLMSDMGVSSFFPEKELIVSVFNDMFTLGQIGGLITNLRLASDHYETDLGPRDLAKLRDTLAAIDSGNANLVDLPGSKYSNLGETVWRPDSNRLELTLQQIIEGLEPYDSQSLVIDVFNGNGIAGFAGQTANRLKNLAYNIDVVDNASSNAERTIIYYQSGYKTAAMELALVLEVDADLREGVYENSSNPVSIVLGKDLIGR